MEYPEIVSLMKTYVAEATGKDLESIDEKANFFKLGISSVQALKIINKLRKKLAVDVSPVAMFEFKCISDLSTYLSECMADAA